MASHVVAVGVACGCPVLLWASISACANDDQIDMNTMGWRMDNQEDDIVVTEGLSNYEIRSTVGNNNDKIR